MHIAQIIHHLKHTRTKSRNLERKTKKKIHRKRKGAQNGNTTRINNTARDQTIRGVRSAIPSTFWTSRASAWKAGNTSLGPASVIMSAAILRLIEFSCGLTNCLFNRTPRARAALIIDAGLCKFVLTFIAVTPLFIRSRPGGFSINPFAARIAKSGEVFWDFCIHFGEAKKVADVRNTYLGGVEERSNAVTNATYFGVGGYYLWDCYASLNKLRPSCSFKVNNDCLRLGLCGLWKKCCMRVLNVVNKNEVNIWETEFRGCSRVMHLSGCYFSQKHCMFLYCTSLSYIDFTNLSGHFFLARQLNSNNR